MYRVCLLLLTALASAAAAAAQSSADPLRLPPEVRGAAGSPLRIKAETAAKKVRWKTFDAGLTLLDPVDLADPRLMIAVACQPGRYVVYAWCAVGDDVSDLVPCVVVVEGRAPPPPPPDGLLLALRAAYDADAGVGKAGHLKTLAAVWRGAVKDCRDPQWTTAGQLLGIVRSASAEVLPADALKGLRTRIAEELRSQMPVDPNAALDEALRAKAEATFERIAAALEAISK